MFCRPTIFEIAVYSVALAIGAMIWLGQGDTGICGPAFEGSNDHIPRTAFRCVEFWLNRYQTLLGTLAAIFAAWYAGYWVQKQLQTAHEQLRAATGDLDPDFAMEWRRDIAGGPGELETALLTITNRNRRDINIRRLEMIEPKIAFALYEYDFSDLRKGQALYEREIQGRFSEDQTSVELDFPIPGHRSSGEMPRARLSLMLVDEGDDVRAGQDEPVCIKVTYDIYGNNTFRKETFIRGHIRRRALHVR